MRLHPNAQLVPAQRFLLVQQIRELQWRVTQAAEAAGVSRQTACKWLNRFDAGGRAPKSHHRAARVANLLKRQLGAWRSQRESNPCLSLERAAS